MPTIFRCVIKQRHVQFINYEVFFLKFSCLYFSKITTSIFLNKNFHRSCVLENMMLNWQTFYSHHDFSISWFLKILILRDFSAKAKQINFQYNFSSDI